MNVPETTQEQIEGLTGARHPLWDTNAGKLVSTQTLYVAYGCPDWGERGGKRNLLCGFCALPHAARIYREKFFNGRMSSKDHLHLFKATLAAASSKEFHTLMIFNAGSFLAMEAELQEEIVREITAYAPIQRVVIESRAELVTETALLRILKILQPKGVALTIRVGVETKDDHLRLKVLRKGHSRRQLHEASSLMRAHGITMGAYTMLNPAPNLKVRWSMNEALETIQWVLGDDDDCLAMDEVYFGTTCVGVDTPLAESWRQGEFKPASLWMVHKVLTEAVAQYGRRVHLLPFVDEPSFLAVPSNHSPLGIAQNLEGAKGCDRAFHATLSAYRTTYDPAVLVVPSCACRPDWV